MTDMDLRACLGEIDIYLFDQLLKGRFDPSMRILDAGCGDGRNLVYFLRNGYEVLAVDQRVEAVEQVRQLAGEIAPGLPPHNFSVAELSELPFPPGRFDAVICSAMLHFARDEEHFTRMLKELWRVLRAGGLFFARLASTIGIEERVEAIQGRRYRLPDGTERFLVDEETLAAATMRLGGRPVEPLKTTNVENRRPSTSAGSTTDGSAIGRADCWKRSIRPGASDGRPNRSLPRGPCSAGPRSDPVPGGADVGFVK